MFGHLVFCLLACTAGLGLGGMCLRVLRVKVASLLDRVSLALPLGMGLLSILLFLLAEVGLLARRPIAILSAAAAITGVFEVVCCLRMAGSLKLDRRALLPLALGGASLLGSLFVALAPVTDGDALCYHLQVPKVFLQHAAACFEPDLHETVYPLATEYLYSAALALTDPVACRLVHWLLGLSLFLSTTALARPYLGSRSLWAGALAVLSPAVSTGMSAPLNDVSLAAFGTAAILAWRLWVGDPKLRMAIVAGLLAGTAAAVKYPGLVLAATLFVAIVVQAGIARQPKRLFHAAAFVAAFMAMGSWSYVRAYIYTGNPVFPFFADAFGGAGLAEVLAASKRPLATSAFNLLTALAPMSLDPVRFDSFSHQFGPVFVCFVPLLLLSRAPRGIVSQTVLALAFLAVCLSARQSTRFVLIVVGPLAVAASWIVQSAFTNRRFGKGVVFTILVLLSVFEAAWSLARCRKFVDVVLGRESTDHYLSRVEPTYVVGKWIDERLPTSARLIGQDHRGFYIPRPYAMELAHRRRTGVGSKKDSANHIVTQLCEEGFTHLVLCPPMSGPEIEFDPTLLKSTAGWLENNRPVYEAELADSDGVVRKYQIYELEAKGGPKP